MSEQERSLTPDRDALGDFTLHPIGYVRNSVTEVRPMKDAWKDIVSEVVLEPVLADGLQGLAGFSHIMVLYWMHRVDQKNRVARPSAARSDGPPAGTFALRTPNRPNPIGVAMVRLIEQRDNVLRVVGLDAVDGTPVLDIKPYSFRHDVVSQPTIPAWAERLW